MIYTISIGCNVIHGRPAVYVKESWLYSWLGSFEVTKKAQIFLSFFICANWLLEVNPQWAKEPFRDDVDANNSDSIDPIAFEETCNNTRCPSIVFTFLLSVTKVNSRIALTNLHHQPGRSQQVFRKIVANALINNYYINQERSGITTRKSLRRYLTYHELRSLPKIWTFRGEVIVPCETTYIQLRCICLVHRVHNYCPYSPGTMQYSLCFADYVKYSTLRTRNVFTPENFIADLTRHFLKITTKTTF